MKYTPHVKTTIINVKFLLLTNNCLDEICSSMIVQKQKKKVQNCCHRSRSSVRGRTSLRSVVKWWGGIQPVLAVVLPSAQTFINITSQPRERPTSNLDTMDSVHKFAHFPVHIFTVLYLHGGAFSSSQELKSWVRSGGAVLCSCERSSSSRCRGFAQAVAWRAGDQTPVWTTLVHLSDERKKTNKTFFFLKIYVLHI